jgi:hypothetical protein
MATDGHLPDKPHELFEWLVARLLARYAPGQDADTRICVVLGAGSSLWSGLTLWDRDFKEKLIERSSDLFRDKHSFVEECWHELSGIVGLPRKKGYARRGELVDRASIEDIASVALKYAVVGDRVYDLLSERFTVDGARGAAGWQPPQLGYELLAHFLKHEFVDHLLTFNFDELLDEAVANELGPSEFVTVATDQDIRTRPPVALPHLIKLHGTLSRPETLRFTRTATASLPPAMTRLLDRIVFDIDPATGHRSPNPRKTYLISMGYGWHDPDMLHWLSARRDHVEGLLILSRNLNDEVERLSGTFGDSEGWRNDRVRILDIDALCSGPPQSISVDLVLSALWNELEREMADRRVPFMPASRHLLLGHLFGPHPNVPGDRLNEHNELTRFVTEFVLHLAKCKGMVNLSTMAGSDRISRYYGPVRDRFSGHAQIADCDLIGLVTSPTFIHHDQFRKTAPAGRTVRLSRYPDVKETYYATATEADELAAPLLDNNGFVIGPPHLPRYSTRKRKIEQAPGGPGGKLFIEHHIKAIFNGPEIEVTRRSSNRESWSLRSATPIGTFIDLQNQTRRVLESDWSDLLAVAETAEWLTKPAMRELVTRPDRSVLLIEADQPAAAEWPLRTRISLDLSETWKEYQKAGVKVLSTALPWWQHNRHLTLAFSKKSRRWVCHGGIYFRRRHKASRIQPMYIEPHDREDIAELVLTFLSYLRRSLDERRRAVAAASLSKMSGSSTLAGRGPQDATAVANMLELRDRVCEIARNLKAPKSVDERIGRLLDELQCTTEQDLLPPGVAGCAGDSHTD